MQWNREAIAAGLNSRGWSNRELARRAGVDASLVHRILHGKRGGRPGGRPHYETVICIAAALDLEPEEIVADDDTIVEPPPEPPKPAPPAPPPEPEPEPWAVNEWEDDDASD